LKAKLIDFDRAVSWLDTGKGTFPGTPGYYPDANILDDSCVKWDLWALGAMILEADLPKDEYIRVINEKGAKLKAQEHLRNGHVNEDLKQLLRMTMMARSLEEMDRLADI